MFRQVWNGGPFQAVQSYLREFLSSFSATEGNARLGNLPQNRGAVINKSNDHAFGRHGVDSLVAYIHLRRDAFDLLAWAGSVARHFLGR